MTHETESKSCCSSKCASKAAYVVAIIGSFLIVLGLVRTMQRITKPEALGQKRAKERADALRDLNAANVEALKTYGWVDQSKGIVRLPVDRAMELTIQQWKTPDAGRSNLLSRVLEATKPVSFE